jgi:hypothetical protein
MGESLIKAEQQKLNQETLPVLAKKLGLSDRTIWRARTGGSIGPTTLTRIRAYLNDEKKAHWTQRPENRTRVMKQLKHMKKIKDLKQKEGTTTNGNGTIHEHPDDPSITNLPAIPLTQEEFHRHLIFAFGKAYGQIAAYSESIGVPVRDFAHRVGTLLQCS